MMGEDQEKETVQNNMKVRKDVFSLYPWETIICDLLSNFVYQGWKSLNIQISQFQ